MNVRSLHLLLFLVLLVAVTEGVKVGRRTKREQGQDGVIGKLKSGLKMAGKLLGLDAASGVASLVASAFGGAGSNPHQEGLKGEIGGWGSKIMAGVMRTLSLDFDKITAIVINAFIFLAQLITTSLVPKNPALPDTERKVKDGSPIDWILDNPSGPLQALITTAKDDKLPEKIINTLKEHSKGTDTSCVQLLVCKTAPFVWGMQRAMAGKMENGTEKKDGGAESGGNALFRHLPEVTEFLEHGDVCEKKYDECRLID